MFLQPRGDRPGAIGPALRDFDVSGTCKRLSEAERGDRIASGRPYALRLDMAAAMAQAGAGQKFFEEKFFEESVGWVTAMPERFGDVVLARRDIPTSYHLCVVHDDAVQGITHVIRGEDLAEATHVHVLLQKLLGLPTPVYAHHKLLTDAGGRRLAKRDGAMSLRAMREAGVAAEDLLRRFKEGQAL